MAAVGKSVSTKQPLENIAVRRPSQACNRAVRVDERGKPDGGDSLRGRAKSGRKAAEGIWSKPVVSIEEQDSAATGKFLECPVAGGGNPSIGLTNKADAVIVELSGLAGGAIDRAIINHHGGPRTMSLFKQRAEAAIYPALRVMSRDDDSDMEG